MVIKQKSVSSVLTHGKTQKDGIFKRDIETPLISDSTDRNMGTEVVFNYKTDAPETPYQQSNRDSLQETTPNSKSNKQNDNDAQQVLQKSSDIVIDYTRFLEEDDNNKRRFKFYIYLMAVSIFFSSFCGISYIFQRRTYQSNWVFGSHILFSLLLIMAINYKKPDLSDMKRLFERWATRILLFFYCLTLVGTVIYTPATNRYNNTENKKTNALFEKARDMVDKKLEPLMNTLTDQKTGITDLQEAYKQILKWKDEFESIYNQLNDRVDTMDAEQKGKFEEIKNEFSLFDESLKIINDRMAEFEKRLDGLEQKSGELEEALYNSEIQQEKLLKKVDDIDKRQEAERKVIDNKGEGEKTQEAIEKETPAFIEQNIYVGCESNLESHETEYRRFVNQASQDIRSHFGAVIISADDQVIFPGTKNKYTTKVGIRVKSNELSKIDEIRDLLLRGGGNWSRYKCVK